MKKPSKKEIERFKKFLFGYPHENTFYELVKKESLGTISKEEQKRLDKLNIERHRYFEDMDYHIPYFCQEYKDYLIDFLEKNI